MKLWVQQMIRKNNIYILEYLLLIVFVFLLCNLFAFKIYADSESNISGKVTNQTMNGSNVEGVEIFLHISDLSGEILETQKTLSDEEGQFSFKYQVTKSESTIYSIFVEYQGVIYSNIIQPEDINDINISVYDAVTDDSIISISSNAILFSDVDLISKKISILEMVNISNSSDLTYTPNDNPMSLIRFSLPNSWENLQVDSNLLQAQVLQVNLGFSLMTNIPPGVHEILYSYEISYEDSDYIFNRSIPYGIDSLKIFILPEFMKIDDISLGAPEIIEFNKKEYSIFEVKSLEKGSDFQYKLTDLPIASFIDNLKNDFSNIRFEYMSSVILILLLVTAPLYVLINKKKQQL